LQRFNEKFDPGWVPRYVYHEALGSLPRVALAYLEAEAITRTPIIGCEGSLRRRRDRRAVTAAV
jgi:lysyl-tRNA synthetase class 2